MKRALSLYIAFALATPAQAAKVTPVTDFKFMGGQHFFDGAASSLSGNLNLTFSPAVKFSDRWSLIPTYMGSYQGTRDVQELAGGGTLFQDSTNHGVLVKGIYSPSENWKLKATMGARYEFLRETKGESWGDGLFDYRKYTGGLEAERALGKTAGLRASYDFYTLQFPNYESLESAQDDTLSRELAGKNTLDSANHLVGLGFWTPVPGNARMDVAAYWNGRAFNDQPVVAASGDLTGTDRSDNNLSMDVSFARPLFMGEALRVVGDLGLGYGFLDSNQHHYDARKTVFLKDYYDYSEMRLAPRLIAALGESNWLVTLGGSWRQRKYDERPIQDANGDYLTDKTDITETTLSLGLSVPMTKNLKLRTAGTLGWSDSNMQYEKVFTYNYKIANYLVGFSYEY